MAIPASYTELSLSDFMHRVLGPVADALGWTAGGDAYTEAVNEALVAYGVSAIASATNIPRLRALARIEAWRAALDALVTRYDISADGQSMSRSQMVEHARNRLRDAVRRAAAYDPAYRVVSGTASSPDDLFASLTLTGDF